MPRSPSSSFFAFTLFISWALATPLPQSSEATLSPASAGCLALGLCLPFVLLAVLKYAYLRHRRAQTIHTSPGKSNRVTSHLPTSVSENEKKSPLVGLGLDTSSVSAAGPLRLPPGLVSRHTTESQVWRRLGLSSVSPTLGRKDAEKVNYAGYLVGILGSPAWETRIQVRRDKVTRKHLAGLSSPDSALSPHSTLSRHPGRSPHLSPYLSQASGTSSQSQSVSLSLPSSLGPSARGRSLTTNYGSVTSSSQASGSHRARKSHRRATSISAPSSRHMSASGHGTSSSKRSASHRRSHSSRTGSTNSKAHSRSLSLSFLEMNSPDMIEPASDFARVTTMAIESVSVSALASGPRSGSGTDGRTTDGARGTFLRPSQFPLPNYACGSASSGITDCASVHPGSPPCPTATPILPFSSVSGTGLHTASVSTSRFDSGRVPGEDNVHKERHLSSVNFTAPRREFDMLEVKTVDARTPQISSQPSPYLSPQYFSPSILPLSPSLSSPPPPASPMLEFKYDIPGSNDRGKRISTGSSSSMRLNLTVSVTPSPSPSPAPSAKASPIASPLQSPALERLTSSGDNKATYLSPTKSSVAKERTKPLNISRPKAKEDGRTDEDEKKQRRKLSILGLGLSSNSPAHVKQARPEKDTFEPSLSGCTTHYRTRSPSPLMPGALPVTPTMGSANVSESSSASGKTPSRRRVSGPTTPNPDSFSISGEGSSDSARGSRKGTSSKDREEVEGLVFGVDTSSGSSASKASKQAKAKEQDSEMKSWTSWDLDDLMTNDGRLDVDAVSAALGLGAPREDDDTWSLEARSVHSVNRLDDVDELESSIESLVRQPGSQLYPIIEEEDDLAEDSELPPAPSPSPRPTSPSVPQNRPTSYLVVSSQPQLHTPFLGTGRESMLTVSTSDIRGSVNESVLDLDLSRLNVDNLNLNDLQFNVSGFDVDASGFATGTNGQGVETSLFGLSSSAERREGEERGVGVAF